MNITGLYRLEVSKKVLVSPSAFQYHIIEFFDFFHSDLSFRHFSCSRSSFLKKKLSAEILKKKYSIPEHTTSGAFSEVQIYSKINFEA